MRVALLSHNAKHGDAVGNQLAAKASFFRDRNADVRLYIEDADRLHPDLCSMTRVVGADLPLEEIAAADLVFIAYSQYYPLLDILPQISGGRAKVVVEYFGVTPAALGASGDRAALAEGARRRDLVWHADAVVVHSSYMRRELCRATGFPKNRVSIAPLLVRPDTATATGTGRRRPAIPSEASVLLFVGRIAPNKRLATLIQVTGRLRGRIPPIHAAIAGDTGDVYAAEVERCRRLAEQLGVADRVHFLGRLSDEALSNAYRSADLFVMPSIHEGFCLPVVEAMAHGLPVVAARTTALPETVAGAGFTFAADDPDDLAETVARVLDSKTRPKPIRVAIVTPGYSDEVLGGAERSLQLIARTLATSGHAVEVFTLADRNGTRHDGPITVHCFRPDDGENDHRSTDHPSVDPRASSRLIESLHSWAAGGGAIIAGPYASGLAWRVAEAMPQQTLLLPCIHNEPLARDPRLPRLMSRGAGILFHSDEERRFAETVLGINHPNRHVIGTVVEPTTPRAAALPPYIVYAGRYCREKRLPELLTFIRRCELENAGRMRFVFAGRGEVAIPKSAIIEDRGFLSESARAELVAGASALVQLSRNESLSLVALEAWSAGVPVIADARCSVLAGHLQRSGGGWSIRGYRDFAAALDEITVNRDAARAKGQRGRDYVTREYGSPSRFAERLQSALASMTLPLAESMRRRGLARAAEFAPAAWEQAFAAFIEGVLDAPPWPCVDRVKARRRPRRVAMRCALDAAEELSELPADYNDVTTGHLACLKRAIKRKLLHQFKRAYVDAIARQQSAFNAQMVRAMREMAATVAALEARLAALSPVAPEPNKEESVP